MKPQKQSKTSGERKLKNLSEIPKSNDPKDWTLDGKPEAEYKVDNKEEEQDKDSTEQ